MPVFIPSWRKSLMITLNSRKRDCSHISILDYTSSTVILLWNQSRFPASSVRYKPDIRHLLMLRKMCLTSLQSDFVWFCCVDLNSIWVGKPVAGNKVTLSSSLDGDGWGFFFHGWELWLICLKDIESNWFLIMLLKCGSKLRWGKM